MLSRDQILQADDLPVLQVPCPEWGGDVFVRTLDATERENIAAKYGNEDGKIGENFLGRFCAIVICDEQGRRIFNDEDAAALGKKNPEVLMRIMEAAQRHNKMSDEAVEELAKNSETSRG